MDYETAHKIGKQLADAVTKGQHEYVLTTHIDKEHVHNHIIFCAVNFVDHHNNVKADIYFTAIGLFDIPTEHELLRTVEKLQEQKQTISKSA